MQSAAYVYLINRGLISPIETLYAILIFIFIKNLNASPFQLTILACSKPITSFFAYYVSSRIFNKPQYLRSYLIINTIFGCIPCLLFPFVQNIWFYIASYFIFMVACRSTYPAWIEILKTCTKSNSLSQIISRGTSIYYFVMVLFPLLVSFWMDTHENLWRYLFVGCAVLNIMNVPFIMRLNIKSHSIASQDFMSLFNIVSDPLKKGWSILKRKPAFFQYQILFFLGGTGIILSQPILPVYFKENLNISYSQLAIAFSFCKGISFVLTSPYWANLTNRISIYQLNVYVNLLTCLFFVFILASNFGINWLFPAYLFYGSMQAGCEMSWNLSGPIFSEKMESTIYSSINLAAIGIRGCIFPFLGHLILMQTNVNVVFLVGGFLTFIALIYGIWLEKQRINLSSSTAVSRLKASLKAHK